MYTLTHWWGKEENNVSVERFKEFIAELDLADAEHASVALRLESEWVISISRGGNTIFENVEGGEPRHMNNVAVDLVLELWRHLAAGDLDWLERQAWKPGYRDK